PPALRAALAADPKLEVTDVAVAEGRRRLARARTDLLVVPGDPPEYVYDASRVESALARAAAENALLRAAAPSAPPARELAIEEPGGRYIDFLVPGLLGMNLMGSSIWGLGFAIVTARSKKLLKRLMATPMSRSQYLLSFMCSRLVFLLLEIVTLLGFGHYAFGVPLRGSLGTLLLICVLAAISFGGLGLLSASRARTTEAVSGIMNFIMLPMWIFSGVFFSAANFPQVVQPFIRLLPLTAVNDALRANMLEGATFASVTPEMTVILVWGVVTFFAALKLFRWR
ncbi:MAG: ABC transporter permease, partial [Gemmatimonadaceae bacterium]